VHGGLTFDDAGIELHVYESLRGPTVVSSTTSGGPMQWATEPVVYGLLRTGEEVTLLEVSGLAVPVDVAEENWSARFALRGGLAGKDRFSRVHVVFDYLLPWTQPAGIFSGALTAKSFTVDTMESILAVATLGDGRTVRLVTGAEGNRSDTSIHLDQWCAFEVTGRPAPLAEILNDWVRPLQDLLVTCLGLPVRLDDIRLGPGGELKLAFGAVQPPVTGRPLVHLAGYATPTLLTYADSPVPFATLITEWFALCDRLPAAVVLLCGPYYAPFIYSQHSYASTFQSAEAIATDLLAGREKLPSEHRTRVVAVKAVLQAADLDADTVGWAIRILQGRNDKPLRQLIEELITATGDMGSQLLTALSDLPQRAADARVGVSHPRDGRAATLERYWMGEALIWVVRVHLLAQLGVAMTDLSARVTAKPMFERIVQELRSLASEEAGAAEPTTSEDGASPTQQEEVATPPVD
jgi:ApeA N-terminal domain 1